MSPFPNDPTSTDPRESEDTMKLLVEVFGGPHVKTPRRFLMATAKDALGGISGVREVQVINLRHATRVLQLLQGKWTLQILCAMRDRPVRLSELKRAMPSASKRALTSSLRSLEAGKIIVRRDLSDTLLHVEYSLSKDRGASIIALLDHIIAWGAALEVSVAATASLLDDVDHPEVDSHVRPIEAIDRHCD